LKEKYKNNGDIEVDVRVPSRLLTPEEEKELNLRLNKNLGQWDFDMLANFDEELLKDVGFESQELDKIFQLDAPNEDDVPEMRQTDIKLGDMFILGEHRLLCGDATKREDIEKLMQGEKADIVFTDPPYGIDLDTDFSDMKRIGRGTKMAGIKGKSGRKPLFKEEMLREGYKLGALGLTIPEIADFWGVGVRTLNRWLAKNPELKLQVERGRREADLTVIQAVLDQARKGNMTAAIFWLKNRCGWRDAYDLKHNGKLAETKIQIINYGANNPSAESGVSTSRVAIESSSEV